MKRIVLLMLCLLLLIPVTAANAASYTSFLNFYEVTEDTLYLFGKELPQGGNVTVSVDSQVISEVKCTSVAEEEIPITVYCLVDVTKDMTEAQIQQQLDILNTISSRMNADDRMVIATLGDTFTEGQPLETLDARKTAIASLQRKGNNPKLFDAVIKAIESLETKTIYSTNRCLVILADGFYDEKDSIKEQQVWDCIQKSTVPVFGISIVKYSNSPYMLQYANIVRRMGLESIGGFGLDPVNDGISAASAAESVWTAVQNGFVASVPLEQIDSRSNNASVSIVYETKDSRFEDSVTVSLAGVAVTETETTETETETTQSETQPTEEIIWEPEPPVKTNWALPVGIAVACAVIACIVFVILRRNRKTPPPVFEPPVGNTEPFDDVTNTVPAETTPAFTPPQETEKNDVMIHFVAILHPDVVCSFGLTTHVSKTIGRSKQADVCLNSADSKLSGKHCIVEWDGQDLYLKDIGSTNGTSLNGSPIKPNTWHRLPNNVKVRLGEYEYRVSIDVI